MVRPVPPQMPRRASRVGVFAALVAVVAAGALAASCANNARDSHCEAEEPDEADCISNPDGLGPKVVEQGCALPAAGEAIIDHAPDFGEILAFMTDPGRGNCSAAGCHGSQGAAAVAIYFDASPSTPGALDPCLTYQKLKTTSGSLGRPYVVEDVLGADGQPDATNEALQSWMYCNVLGLEGGGFPMPKPGGVPVQDDAILIHDWIISGAHGPQGCAETGGL